MNEKVVKGLCERTASEKSPNFDESSHEPPAKKCRQRKRLLKKSAKAKFVNSRYLRAVAPTRYSKRVPVIVQSCRCVFYW